MNGVDNNKTDIGSEDILNTSNRQVMSSWDRLLEIQVDLFLPFEINYYLSNNAWTGAKRILDAGCGNGSYLSRLHSFFPDKSYTGIDLSPEMIEVAKSRYGDASFTFEQADFLQYQNSKKFDIVLMRLIVQHMSGFGEILKNAAKLLSPQGSLIIIEPDIEGFLNVPDTPLFGRLLKEYGEFTEKTAKNRALLSRIDQLVDEDPNWHVISQELVTVPRIGPHKDTKLLEMFFLWIELFEQSNVLDFPYSKVCEELDEWSLSSATYSQLGIRAIELECNNRG